VSTQTSERFQQQVSFLLEVDKLKTVLRQTVLTDGSRRENSAEHSWHLSLLALFLQEYTAEEVDVTRVMKMVLVHDLVEIDAGDTFFYDTDAEGKEQREKAAAERIFNLLPEDQAAELFSLWDEFEARETAEARYAYALDRFQPVLHNLQTEGHGWRQHGVTLEQVIERNQPMEEGAPELWRYVRQRLDEAVEKGHLGKG
jgi:putative hydrolase of HD superfamily